MAGCAWRNRGHCKAAPQAVDQGLTKGAALPSSCAATASAAHAAGAVVFVAPRKSESPRRGGIVALQVTSLQQANQQTPLTLPGQPFHWPFPGLGRG